jgi:hypothetical protein
MKGMDGACSAYGGEERCVQGFGGRNLKVIDNVETLHIGRKIILKSMLRSYNGRELILCFNVGIMDGLL